MGWEWKMEMKNTLKKVLAVVVLVAMAFTLTACGDSQEKAYKKANKLLNGLSYHIKRNREEKDSDSRKHPVQW